MKRCQKCSRTFPDENQKFCTFDGGLLISDQPAFDPNRTIIGSFEAPSPVAPKPPVPAPQPPPPPAPARDMSETIVAFRPPSPTPPADASTVQTGGPTTDLVPPEAAIGGQTSADLTPPPGAPTSSDLTLPYSTPTSAELPPAAPAAPPRTTQPPPASPARDMSETLVAFRFPEASTGAESSSAPTGGSTGSLGPQSGATTSSDLTLPYSTPTPAEPTPVSPPPVEPPAPPPVQYTPPPPPVEPPAPPPVQYTPPPPPVQAPVPQPPAPVVAKPKKRSMVPVLVGILVVLLLLGSGIGVAGYIFRGKIKALLKPYLERNGGGTEPANTNTNPDTNTNKDGGNSNTTANANNNTPPKTEEFVPPTDAVQFTNSKASLDGDLADHYVGFSFYYPKTFKKDPNAGVAGASSFATITREFSDATGDIVQERVAFTSYPSNGSYDSDAPVFAERTKKVVDQVSQSLPNYQEVSRGEVTINGYKGYEVRYKGEIKTPAGKTVPYWGRVIFLPPASPTEKGGVAIKMLATSYSPGVTSAEDVGAKGDLEMVLKSFRLTGKP